MALGPLQKQWIADLRSGDFKQGTGFLNYHGSCCCLGVLCETLIKENHFIEKIMDGEEVGKIRYNGMSGEPPGAAMQAVGLRPTAAKRLIGLNDRFGLSFDDIATIIETNPEEFFTEEL